MKACIIGHKDFIVHIRRYFVVFAVLFMCMGGAQAQEEETMPEKDTRPVKNIFESIWLLDNQTLMVPIKGTLEIDFQHRFGTWDSGYDNLFGIFAPSNMRIGVDYVPADRLLIGFGFTKKDVIWDVYGKYALLRQGRKGGSPLSITYYVNAAMDSREIDKTNFEEFSDRWSFFHQVMIGRKISENFTLQLSGNLSWFNYRVPVTDNAGVFQGRDQNAHISASALARYKISTTMGIIAEYDLPITDQKFFNPEPNLSIGLELVTSSHAFQIFVGNYQNLIPQYNHTFNTNNFADNQILLGFNITRLWNF